EFERVDVRVRRPQPGPQRVVERVDRSVAFRGRDHALTAYPQLHGRFADHVAVRTVFHDDAVRFEVERGDDTARERGAHEELERGVGGLERPAGRLELLHRVRHLRQRVRLAGQVETELT